MADIRVSLGPLHSMVDEYLNLFKQAKKIEVDLEEGQREPLTDVKREKILDSLTLASDALAQGCQQTVYGLFFTPKE